MSVFRQCLRRVTFAFFFVFSRENLALAAKYLGMALFCVLLVIFTLPPWLVVKVNSLIVRFRPSFRTRATRICKFLVGWAWFLMLKCACCIFRLKLEGVREMNKSLKAGGGKPRLILVNHTSYMDAMALGAFLSSTVRQDLVALVSSHLLDMPILGGIVEGAGHLPIKFNSLKTSRPPGSRVSIADMSVDKGIADDSIQEFENWVREGHVGMWFPEGRINPHPLQLQMFRAGGFKIAVDVDCEMWCCIFAGLEVFWHRKAYVGGAPANCGMKAFRLCSSSHSLIQELSGGDRVDDKMKGVLLANHAQAKMQEKRDEMTADPWISKLEDLVGGEMTGVAMVEYRSGASLVGNLYQAAETSTPRGAHSPSDYPKGENVQLAAEEAQGPIAASSAAGAAPAGQAGRSGAEPVDLLGPGAPGDADRAGGGPADLLGYSEEPIVVRNLESFTG